MKNHVKIMLLGIVAIFLCACQSSPNNDVVTSKNDGAFDSNVVQSATEGCASKTVQYSDTFISTDGSVEISFAIDQTVTSEPLPVVEIVPHYLTGEDVKRVAQALFGEADFYEREPDYNPQYSASQLRDKVNMWSAYSSQEALTELYGIDVDWSDDINIIKKYIQTFTEQLESAPEVDPRTPCDWTLKKESTYFEIDATSNDILCATVNTEKAEYLLTGVTRNQNDFKLNGITVKLGDGVYLPTVEQAIYRARLCRTDTPTSDQISAVKETAQSMLNQMKLGEWLVRDAYTVTEYCGDTPEYTIRVDASPILNELAAVPGQMIHDLTSDNTYTSNYYITNAYFLFSANGDLVFFGMDSPIEIKNVVNTNVATLSMDELIEKAKTHLSLCDAKAGIGVPSGFVELYEENYGEDIVCKIEICELVYGLGRVKAKDTEDSYYYLPVLSCKGIANYYGKDSGELYMSSSDYGATLQNLVWINAVDGTIIEG